MNREHFQCQGQNVSCPITGFKLSFGDADKITKPAPSHIVSLTLTACPQKHLFLFFTHLRRQNYTFAFLNDHRDRTFNCMQICVYVPLANPPSVFTSSLCTFALYGFCRACLVLVTRGTFVLSQPSERRKSGLQVNAMLSEAFLLKSLTNSHKHKLYKTQMLKTGTNQFRMSTGKKENLFCISLDRK